MKRAFVYLVLINLLLATGPVCGNHQTTVESMACCEKAHNHNSDSIFLDAHSSACCFDCDPEVLQGIKQQDQTRLLVSFEPIEFLSNVTLHLSLMIRLQDWESTPIASSSPPDVFLLDRSLRI